MPTGDSSAGGLPGAALAERVARLDLEEVRFQLRRLMDARLVAPLNGHDQILWIHLVNRERDLLGVEPA